MKDWFKTVRSDTNGYLLGLLERMYESTGFPRSKWASLDEDTLTVEQYNLTFNFRAQDTLVICSEL